ncbi:uncharacterized protein LOC134802020 [Cydia splendana]|uniref:uncharacterized protein LOC134802020 n=1 Tax=Cydia splendana TaxID=1100963 RepID=UPI0028F4A67E
MQGEWVILVLCAFPVKADIATTAPAPTTHDVNAKWLEGFRRNLLRDSYDYGPAPAVPSSRASSARSRQNASEDAVASREFGISRRDLRGPKPDRDVITDAELDGPNSPRRAFLDSMYELEDQLKPIYRIRSNKHSSIDPLQESRKRWNQHNTEQDIPRYIEENGIKRYKVHTNSKERYRNKLVDAFPRLAEEWGIINPQEETHVSASEGEYRQHNNERIEDRYRYVDRIPYNQGKYENKRNDRLSRNEDENSSSDESASSETQERDVSENKQEIRSRYVVDRRRNAGGGYGERFAARRDEELLADGMSSSSKPCSCQSEHSLVPEI